MKSGLGRSGSTVCAEIKDSNFPKILDWSYLILFSLPTSPCSLQMCRYRVTQKNGNFWKTQQKLKKSKKKKILTEIEPLQLAFWETVIQIISVWKLRPVDGVLLHYHYAFQKFPFFCVTCSGECDRVAFCRACNTLRMTQKNGNFWNA